MSKLTDEDKLLFTAAMEEVTPLQTKNKVHIPPPKPSVKATLQNKRPSTMDTNLSFTESLADSQKVSAFESIQFSRPGIRMQEIIKLKKGDFSSEWQLDLHGMTELEADRQLLEFITQANQHNIRYLIIVHGKGYNSDLDYPILKNLVNQRLRQAKPVLAFCSAQPKDGGTGAVYVFLKQNP